MVTNPDQWVQDFAKAGADMYTFHIEATKDPNGLITKIKQAGMQVGIAIKPATPVADILPYCSQVDLILIMTVEPGFGGQKLIQSTIPKIQELRNAYPLLNIQVDGGIDVNNVHLVADAGANVIVAGTGIFGHPSPTEAIAKMSAAVQKVIDSKK